MNTVDQPVDLVVEFDTAFFSFSICSREGRTVDFDVPLSGRVGQMDLFNIQLNLFFQAPKTRTANTRVKSFVFIILFFEN